MHTTKHTGLLVKHLEYNEALSKCHPHSGGDEAGTGINKERKREIVW